MNTNCESMAYRSFSSLEFEARGVRKVTIGIYQPDLTPLHEACTQPIGNNNQYRVNTLLVYYYYTYTTYTKGYTP